MTGLVVNQKRPATVAGASPLLICFALLRGETARLL